MVKSFKSEFNRGFMKSCIKSGTKTLVDMGRKLNVTVKKNLNKYCKCSLKQFHETKNINIATNRCLKKMGGTKRTRRNRRS